MQIVIRLPMSTDPHPDTGVSIAGPKPTSEEVYAYLRELMDDDSLSFTVEDD